MAAYNPDELFGAPVADKAASGKAPRYNPDDLFGPKAADKPAPTETTWSDKAKEVAAKVGSLAGDGTDPNERPAGERRGGSRRETGAPYVAPEQGAGAGRGSINPPMAAQSLADTEPRARRGGLRSEAKPYVAGDERIPAPPPPPRYEGTLDRPVSAEQKFDWAGPAGEQTALELASGVSIRPGAESEVADRIRRDGKAVPGDPKSRTTYADNIPQSLIDKIDSPTGRQVADLWVSAGQMVPQTLKLGSDIAQIVTLGGTEPLSRALEQWSTKLGGAQSYEQQMAAVKFKALLQNPNAEVAQITGFLLENQAFTVNTALPSMGSMLVGVGGAKIGQKLAASAAERAGLIGAELTAAGREGAVFGANLTNAAMNAGDTFDQTDGGLAQKMLAAGGAAAATMAVGRFTDGGVEAQMAGGGARRLSANPVADVAGRMGMSGGKEYLQESGEQLGQDVSQGLAEGKPLDANTLAKSAGAAGVQGAVLGLAGGAGGATGIPLDSRATFTSRQLPEELAAGAINNNAERFSSYFFGRPIEEAGSTVTKPQPPTKLVADSLSRFDELAAAFGLSPEAVAAVRKQAGSKPAADVPGFLSRVTHALNARGLFSKPVDDASVQALDATLSGSRKPTPPAEVPGEEVPGANGGQQTDTAPVDDPLDAGGLLGTVDDGAHGAATSPTNDLPEPTDAQKKAGNYQVGRVKLGGLDISIENPQGSVRRGVDEDGKAWENELQHHYGYVRGTIGNDGDHVDAFIKPGTPEDYAGPVFVVDQRNPKTGAFDEHKVLLGFDSPEEAEDAYRSNYAPDWDGLGYLSGMDMPAFQSWIKNGNHKQPFSAGFKETRSAQPDLAVPPAVAAGPGVPGGAVPGGSSGTVGSQPAGGREGVEPTADAPVPGGGTAVPAGGRGKPNTALSDKPDYEATYPRPLGGKNSQFDGLEDDEPTLSKAVAGVHKQARDDITTSLKAARAAVEAGDKEALGEAMTEIDGTLGEYADEFGPDHAKAFTAKTAPDLEKLRGSLVAPASEKPPKVATVATPGAAPREKSQAEKDEDAALDDLSDALGTGAPAAPAVDDAAPAQAPEVKAKKERAKKASKGVSFYPKTIWGSEMLADISRQLGGLSPDLMTSLSFKQPTGKFTKNGTPITRWHNPSAGKNVPGGLFRVGGIGDTNLLAEWMEREGYILPGTYEADYKAADELARQLITAALNREATPTMLELEREAESLREEEDAYYRGMALEDAEQAEEDRRFLLGEAAIAPADMSIPEDAWFAVDNEVWQGPQTYEDLLQSFGLSDSEINDAIFQEQRFDDANNDARDRREGAAGEETGSDEPGRPGAPDPAGAPAPRPSGDDERQATREVDAAVGRLTDDQVATVATAIGIREDAPVETKRTLLLTHDALEVLAAIQQLPPAFSLEAPSADDLRARAAMEAAARSGDIAEQRRLAGIEAARKRELEKKRADAEAEKIRKERADAAVDGFELGQEPPSATVTNSDIVGQEDIFGAQEEQSSPVAARDEALIDLRKRASVLKALRKCLG